MVAGACNRSQKLSVLTTLYFALECELSKWRKPRAAWHEGFPGCKASVGEINEE